MAQITLPPTGMVYPTSGLPQSTGTAWGSSIALVTSVGSPGADTNVATEKAIATALALKAPVTNAALVTPSLGVATATSINGLALKLVNTHDAVIGPGAGAALTSGDDNILLGYQAGAALTTTGGNILLGSGAGNAITAGNRHIVIGYNAGQHLGAYATQGPDYYNPSICIGDRAGQFLADEGYGNGHTGDNTAIGQRVLQTATTGVAECICIGSLVGQVLVNAFGATVIGMDALEYTPSVGLYALIIGYGAAMATDSYGDSTGITLGTHHVFIGDHVAYYHGVTGNYNTVIGGRAAQYLKGTAAFNTLGGGGAGNGDTTNGLTGSNNSAWGYHALYVLGSGHDNVALGVNAGQTLTTGAFNTILGPDADVGTATLSYGIALGAYAKITAANQLVIGGDDGSGNGHITDAYLGSGVTLASPPAVTLHSTGGLGTDNAGADLLLASGQGTGAGAASAIRLRTPTAGSTGSTGQTMAERLTVTVAGIGIGVPSPTAHLHLAAGGTAAGSAALKLTSGSLLTAAEDGAVGYDGSHLYFTIGSTRYQIDQQTVGYALLASPSFTTPALGVATATSLNALTLTSLATGFSVAGGTTSKTLTVDVTASISALAPLTSPSFTTPTLGVATGTRLGLGQAADAGAVMAATGQYFAAQHTCTVTLDWNNGNCQSILLASGAQTFTFANPKAGGRYLLRLQQPASSSAGTVTWPGNVHWSGAIAPVLTLTNGQVDIVTFYYDGTSFFGASALNFAP